MERSELTALPSFLLALLALLGSAILLVGGFATFKMTQISEATGNAPVLSVPASRLMTIAGRAEKQAEKLVITGYENSNGTYLYLAAARQRFQAEDYPLVRYRYSSPHPGPVLQLVWETNDGTVHITELSRTPSGIGVEDMTQRNNWRGPVVRIGLRVIARDEAREFEFKDLTLLTGDWRAEAAKLWSDWTSFRGWSQRSINRVYGTQQIDALSPVPVAAAWSGLALVVFLVIAFLIAIPSRGSYFVILLLPWMGLDMLWQSELTSKLQDSREQFSGKSRHEQHLADIDGKIYQHARRLIKEVLPTEPARILILSSSLDNSFQRLKTQFYLLPHNIYNYDTLPPSRGVYYFDYILSLGNNPQLLYNAEKGRLEWPTGRGTLRVELVDSDPLGVLYRTVRANQSRRKDRD